MIAPLCNDAKLPYFVLKVPQFVIRITPKFTLYYRSVYYKVYYKGFVLRYQIFEELFSIIESTLAEMINFSRKLKQPANGEIVLMSIKLLFSS